VILRRRGSRMTWIITFQAVLRSSSWAEVIVVHLYCLDRYLNLFVWWRMIWSYYFIIILCRLGGSHRSQ
jgi:hypothetical protein